MRKSFCIFMKLILFALVYSENQFVCVWHFIVFLQEIIATIIVIIEHSTLLESSLCSGFLFLQCTKEAFSGNKDMKQFSPPCGFLHVFICSLSTVKCFKTSGCWSNFSPSEIQFSSGWWALVDLWHQCKVWFNLVGGGTFLKVIQFCKS